MSFFKDFDRTTKTLHLALLVPLIGTGGLAENLPPLEVRALKFCPPPWHDIGYK